MKIAYIYNRPSAVVAEWGVDKVYIDAPGTMRMERKEMIHVGGIRQGDTLVLAAMSDLGSGSVGSAFAELIKSKGVKIDVRPIPQERAKQKPPRAPRLRPTDAQKRQICALWSSGLEQSHVRYRAAQIVGSETVTRNQLNRLCGPRFKAKDQ